MRPPGCETSATVTILPTAFRRVGRQRSRSRDLRLVPARGLAAALLSLTGAAQRSTGPTTSRARRSSGNYLAARHASCSATRPRPPPITARRCGPIRATASCSSRAFLSVLANGEVDEAVKLAERVLQVDKTDRIARLVLGVRAIKQKQYPAARTQLGPDRCAVPITDLTATLLSAWTLPAPAEAKARDRRDRQAGRRRTGTRSSRTCMPA